MKIIKPTIIIISLLALALSATAVGAAATEHMVVRGDTMWKIARSYGVSLEDLIEANPHIKNPSLIYPNDKLYIPHGNSVEDEVLRLSNNYRAKQGLGALKLDWELCRVARAKADDMAAKGYFSHQSPTYGSPSDMLKSFGVSYRYMGENIAKGYRDASSVMTGWMNSEGHRANILNGKFTKLGVGYNSTANTWVQIFT